MPLIRPSTCLRATQQTLPLANTLTKASINTSKATTTRSFSSTQTAKAADHGGAHEDHFDPPTGWLWGIKPGEKVEKEGWENLWIYGFFGSLGLGVVGYAFKPDTS